MAHSGNTHEITCATLRNLGWAIHDADQSGDLVVAREGNTSIIVDVSDLLTERELALVDLKHRIQVAEARVAGCRHVD